MKKYLALATISMLVAAPAMAAETFTRDGVSYEYNVTQSGDYQLITGRDLSTGRTFSLKVRGTHVNGTYGDNSVAFEAPKNEQLASSN